MKQATIALLHALNRRFYAQHAQEFSATRRTPWPGLTRALELARSAGTAVGADRMRVLDVGCGNGRALPALLAHAASGLDYLGVDASEPLLAIARARWSAPTVRFASADFVADGAERALPDERFERVLLLGVLHCVPSQAARRELLLAAARRVAPRGALVLTIWRYDRDPRFAERCVAPDRLGELAPGLVPGELDPGDALLRFGQSADAVRYAHFPDDAELARLTAGLGLVAGPRFESDGAGQRLNEYRLLLAPSAEDAAGTHDG